MKYVIDEDVCKANHLSLDELLALLLIKVGENVDEVFQRLLDKKAILKNNISGDNYYINQSWDNLCQKILLSSDNSIPTEDRIDNLVEQLREIFPLGKKPGTGLYWRGNPRDVKLKLQKFFKLYGNKYTEEQILEATKKYVEGFNGQYGYMRVLVYFIHKNAHKVDSEGNGYIEEVSDLATYIENMGQEDSLSNNWMEELR